MNASPYLVVHYVDDCSVSFVLVNNTLPSECGPLLSREQTSLVKLEDVAIDVSVVTSVF